MNYFSHAHLAASHRDEPHFALGAMLPDWTRWIGDRPRQIDHGALAAGVRFHHACDAAFHAAPSFLALVRDSTEALQQGGLDRGPARGAAHVGIELLLDGALLASGADRGEAYVAALRIAPEAGAWVTWSRPASAHRLERLTRRLAAEGPPRGFTEPGRVARALARTLEARPRLRIPADRIGVVARWAETIRDRVAREAPILLAETTRGLRAEAMP